MRDFGLVKFSTFFISNNMKQLGSGKLLLPAILIVAVTAILGHNNVTADEVPAFFLKIAKNLPRIGRSYRENDYLTKNSNGEGDKEWFDPQDVNEVSKRKIGFSQESDTWNWQHFPLAIEGPPELWRSLAGYSNDPLYQPSEQGFNNDIWSRDKRATSDF